MKKTIPILLLAFGILLVGGQLSSAIQRTSLQSELAQLMQRGLTYRFLDNNTVRISEEWSGFSRIKKLNDPTEADIRLWAASRNIPIIEIDPALIDTNRYAGRYRYWTQVPLSNGSGFPLAVADFNHDGNPEVYGVYHYSNQFEYSAHIYQIDSTGLSSLEHTYTPYPGVSAGVSDVDRNGRSEAYWTSAYVMRFFEQTNLSTLPSTLSLTYSTIVENLGVNYTLPAIGILDADSSTDLLYYGTFPDSADTTNAVSGFAVAEYDSTLHNFKRVWSERSNDGLGGLTIDDFDRNGRNDFCCSLAGGEVRVYETIADNRYQMVWHDSVPFVNFYYGTSGDVDGDGKPELFRGATMGNGNWTIVYEADSTHHYSPRVLFHFLSGGTGDDPTYIVTDVDGDGKLEFVLMSGTHVFMFKSFANDSYTLWYYKKENTKDALTLFDLNGDGKKDIIISKTAPLDSIGRWRNYADLYLATSLLSITPNQSQPMGFELYQNYPNPFNSETTITYEMLRPERVKLTVIDLLGRVVTTLVDEEQTIGRHQVRWNAVGFSSGMYVYRLSSGKISLSKKLLLIR